MNKLKRKIKILESQMNADAVFKEQQLYLLKKYFKKPLYISAAIAGSIGLGYMLSRKGGGKKMAGLLLSTPFFVLRTVRNVQLLSLII